MVGLAASVPFDKEHPRDPVNRRISIVVLDSDRPAGRTAARGVTAAAPPRAGSIATAALARTEDRGNAP